MASAQSSAAPLVGSLSLQSAGAINLAVGHPSTRLLAHSVLADACLAASARLQAGDFALSYGRTVGEKGVNEELAAWLSRPDEPVRPERLFVTSGVSQSLDLLCSVLTKPGDTVVVVRPTYFLAAAIFREHGLRVTETPSSDNGLDLGALRAQLAAGLRPRLLYIVPSHANPSGLTLPAQQRSELAALAAEHRFWVVADEVYHALSWSTEPAPPRMRAYDDCPADAAADFDGDDKPLTARAAAAAALEPQPGALMVSTASLSKLLAPGLRLGWIEAPAAVLQRLMQRAWLVSGGGMTPFASQVALEALRSGRLDSHLRLLCSTYARRCAVLCDALRSHPVGWSFVQPCGGYFVWLRLPTDVSVAALQAQAAGRVAFLDGSRCASGPAPATGGSADAEAHIRLCFAWLEEAELVEGVARLAAAVAAVRTRT